LSALAAALAVVAFATAAVSGVAGLGGGAILIAVLFAVGLTPAVAVPLFAAVQFVANLSRTLAYARYVRWRAMGWFLVTGLPAPFLVAPLVAHANVHVLQLLLAAVILISLVPRPAGRLTVSERGAFLWAGLLNGSVGMFVGATGVLVGRLFLRPEWSKETVVGTMAMTQALGHLLKIAGFASAGFGVLARSDLLLPMVVAVIAGSFAGRNINRYLPDAAFRRVFTTLLVVLSLKLLWDGTWGLIAA
jgi:uncharacterized protein